MLAQIHPFIAAEVAYRREHITATFPCSTGHSDEMPRPQIRGRRHLVPRLVRRAFAPH
jgi:hypothetical protein